MTLFSAILVILATSSVGNSNGYGAIVLQDFTPVYQSSTGEVTVATLMRGNAVSAGRLNGVLGSFADLHGFQEADGRLRVMFVAGSPTGARRFGWVDPQALEPFVYSGSCAVNSGPFAESYVDVPLSHLPSLRWNPCFEAARDAKL